MADTSSLLSGGTVGALVVALGFVGRIVVGGLKEYRESRAESRKDEHEKSAGLSARVQDEATQITVLNGTVETLGKENERLTKRVAKLEDDLTRRDEKIVLLQSEINDLQSRLTKVSEDLRALTDGRAD